MRSPLPFKVEPVPTVGISRLMVFSGQHGAPTIDAIGHISTGGKLYGGIDAAASEGTAGLTALGIETYPKEKFVNRGVLLDVAHYRGVAELEAGLITADDLEKTRQAVVSSGGVVVKDIFTFPGGRRFHFTDPNGNELAVWSDH